MTCARFNQGSTSIASGSETGEIILYNVVTGQGCRPMVAPNVQVGVGKGQDVDLLCALL